MRALTLISDYYRTEQKYIETQILSERDATILYSDTQELVEYYFSHHSFAPIEFDPERQPIDLQGRSYGFGDWAKTNKVSKRPLTQASLRCKRWLKPSSLQRIPTPLNRC